MKESNQESAESSGDETTPKKASSKELLGRLMHSEWLMLVIALLAAVVVFSIPAIREHVVRVRVATQRARQQKSALALAEGLRLAATANTRDEAFESLHLALDSAYIPNARQDALLAIGEFLLTSARKSPAEFALPARQYLRVALAEETRPDRRLRILTGLLAVARLQTDLTDLRSVCAEVHQEKMADEDRVDFLTAQLDTMLAMGQWSDISGLLQELLPFEANPRFSAEVGLRWEAVHEQILNRKDYFAIWRKGLADAGESASDEELRGGLFTNLLVKLDEVSKGASNRITAEAKFRAFRLVFKDGRYDEAGWRLENLHLHDLGENEREATLLSIELARHENHLRVFQDRVLRYIEAYSIDAAIEPYFFDTLNLRIASGKGSEVLNLLEQKLMQTDDAEQRARLLQYMGDLARRLKSDAVADRCYEDILNMPKAAAYHSKAMIARCGICTDHGDLTTACQWLDRYLKQYPDRREWREVAENLVKRLRATPERGGADLISIALVLANRQPNDALSGEFISLVARQMETLGMSSLAHNYYNRILLQPVSLAKTNMAGSLPDAAPAAVLLGNARCLLDLNRKIEAERMLRSVCGGVVPNESRSEAALLWAGMALDRDQKRESERRLGLVDVKHCDTNVMWQANVNRLLLRVPSSTNSTAAATELLSVLRDPAALAHPDLVRKVYETCFESLVAHNDAAGLHMVFASTNAVMSENALDEYRLRIAKQYLARQDYSAATEWLQQSSLNLSNVVAVITKNNQMLSHYR